MNRAAELPSAPALDAGAGAATARLARRHVVSEAAGDARVFEYEPDLVGHLPKKQRDYVRKVAVAKARSLERGVWETDRDPAVGPGYFGLLVLDGILVRRCAVAGRSSLELLSCGDVLCPDLAHRDPGASLPQEGHWRILERARLAVLGDDFVVGIAGLPGIFPQLSRRLLRRSRDLALRLALVDEPVLELRLDRLLWHLADRHGRRRGDAVTVELPLTHQLTADLAGADVSAVSRALGRLCRRGRLARSQDRRFVLTGDPSEVPCASP